MALPSSVPSNATHIGQGSFSISYANAILRPLTRVVINNTGMVSATVNAYVVLDVASSSPTLVDALPLLFPVGQTRDEFSSTPLSVAVGSHTLDLYLYATLADVNWVWADFNLNIVLA